MTAQQGRGCKGAVLREGHVHREGQVLHRQRQVLQSIIQPHNAEVRDRKIWVTWQWLPAVREPRKREALPSRA